MIISKTPVRISFLGGGTDYPDHFRRCGGATLATSIDKYSYVTVKELRDLFEYKIRVGYSRTELVDHAGQIEHPSVRECLRHLGLEAHLEIHYIGDLPARTGLGSSSSFTVGLLHALHAYKGEVVSPRELGREAILVEQERIGERVGCQDQYICALGGLRMLEFQTDGGVRAEPLPVRRERVEALERSLLLFYTGISRQAHEILGEQLQRTQDGAVSGELGSLEQLAREGAAVLCRDGDLRVFGELLHQGWTLKRSLSSRISSDRIDQLYARARAAGAIGGKLLGAGGGGFLLFFVEPGAAAAVRAALEELKEVPFRFERQGTTLLFYDR
jgi:D-glycero-alpha-D-manno-heptose-7-phosphate kinase